MTNACEWEGIKTTAKEFLSQAQWIDARIESKCEEAERLRAKITSGRLSQITGMPRGGSGGDWTDTVAYILKLEADINNEVMKLCRVKRQIAEAIEQVEDMRYRTLLELRYRSNMKWECIAAEMNYEVRHVTRLHGEALQCVVVPETCP